MKLTDEQCLIRDSVRGYVQSRIAPYAAEWDKNGQFPAEQLKEMGRTRSVRYGHPGAMGWQ